VAPAALDGPTQSGVVREVGVAGDQTGRDGAHLPEQIGVAHEVGQAQLGQVTGLAGAEPLAGTADAQVLFRDLESSEGDWVKLVNRKQQMIAVGTIIERIGESGVGVVQPRIVFH